MSHPRCVYMKNRCGYQSIVLLTDTHTYSWWRIILSRFMDVISRGFFFIGVNDASFVRTSSDIWVNRCNYAESVTFVRKRSNISLCITRIYIYIYSFYWLLNTAGMSHLTINIYYIYVYIYIYSYALLQGIISSYPRIMNSSNFHELWHFTRHFWSLFLLNRWVWALLVWLDSLHTKKDLNLIHTSLGHT